MLWLEGPPISAVCLQYYNAVKPIGKKYVIVRQLFYSLGAFRWVNFHSPTLLIAVTASCVDSTKLSLMFSGCVLIWWQLCEQCNLVQCFLQLRAYDNKCKNITSKCTYSYRVRHITPHMSLLRSLQLTVHLCSKATLNLHHCQLRKCKCARHWWIMLVLELLSDWLHTLLYGVLKCNLFRQIEKYNSEVFS